MFWRSGAERSEGARKFTAPVAILLFYRTPPPLAPLLSLSFWGPTYSPPGVRGGREASFAPKRPAAALGRPATHDFPLISAARRAQESLGRTLLGRKFLRQVAGGRALAGLGLAGLGLAGLGRVGSGRRLRFFSKIKLRSRSAAIIVVVFCVSSLGSRRS